MSPYEMAERARELGDDIVAHRAVISSLSEERADVIFELSRVWPAKRIATELGVSQARVSVLIRRGEERAGIPRAGKNKAAGRPRSESGAEGVQRGNRRRADEAVEP